MLKIKQYLNLTKVGVHIFQICCFFNKITQQYQIKILCHPIAHTRLPVSSSCPKIQIISIKLLLGFCSTIKRLRLVHVCVLEENSIHLQLYLK